MLANAPQKVCGLLLSLLTQRASLETLVCELTDPTFLLCDTDLSVRSVMLQYPC